MTPAVLASIDPSSNEFSGIAWSPACGAALIVMLSLGVIAAGAWGVWKTRRGAGALGARVAAAIGLGAILFGPVQFERVPDESARPAVAYLLDTSSSMALSDQPGPDGDHAICTRIDAIRRSWLASEAIREVDNAADLRLIGFDERPTPMTLERARSMDPIGERTRLVESVGAVLGGFANGGASTTDSGPPGRVSDAVLFTDGADTDGTPLGALAGAALASGVRLHAVAVGKDVRPSDISIQASADSALVYDGQPTTLRIRIRQSGFDRRPARLTVREITGDAASTDQQGRLIHAETIVLEHSNDLAVSVTPSRPPSQGETPVSNGGGTALIEYIASVEPLAGEADATNNTRSTFVQVSGARIRVCVFEAEPYWDSRFFIAAMRDDPQVELTTVIGLGAVRQGERTEPRVIVTRSIPGPTRGHEERLDNVPLADDELAQFDVIALGKGVEMFFPGDEARKLVRYAAERGGSLVFLRGKPITHTDAPATEAARILGAVSPVEWGAIALRGSKLARTDEGRRQPVLDFERLGPSDAILTELPGMLAATSVERERALSVVWLRQVQGESGAGSGPVVGDPAALAHMSVGQGRSLAVLADGMWRWAFLPTQQHPFTGVYRLFWARAIRWLALGGEFLPGQSVSLSVDPLTAVPGETVSIAARVRYAEPSGFTPSLTITSPDGAVSTIALKQAGEEGERFTAAFTPSVEGAYTAELLAPGMTPDRLTTRFAVYDDRPEIRDTASRPDELRALCESTGGQLFALDDSPKLAELLRKEAEARRSTAKSVPAWDRAWVFFTIVTLLAGEWFWRRRIGLP